ncbi:CopG family transcriptional regulator [Bacillus sp. FJAT-49732]|uniref:CopG family transcriptional regulator n=1 Tax=Lederbergia citrisecunda TaxID=2833583 RepID=A0A942TSF1_9BACI|nr:CopG family transcriptional regulator [Lederbergia citrisecunda]
MPPYKYNLLPEHLRHSNSAKRESAGRPSLGITKKLSLTLPKDIWDKIEKEIEEKELKSMSAYLRRMILNHYKNTR